MRLSPFRLRPFLGLAFFSASVATLGAQNFTPTEDGLYVVFATTAGELPLKLAFDQAPVTTASFLGLAAGTIPHYAAGSDTPVHEPFYEGIAMHRVIAGFVIQFGSPNGQGTDGPGYTFPDEIVPSLKHDRVGVLSMANSGPNSNGSQVFITLGATTATHLDGKHAVFGEFVGAPSVLSAIGSTPVGAGDRPVTPITITDTFVIRRGAAAEAFDETRYAVLFDPDLPQVPTAATPAPAPAAEATVAGGALVLTGARHPLGRTVLERSIDFGTWTEVAQSALPSLRPTAPYRFTRPIEAGGDGAFYRMREVVSRTADAQGHRLVLNLEGNTAIVYEFTAGGTGTVTYNGNTGAINAYYWYPLDGVDQLHIASALVRTLQCYLRWQSATGGTVFVRAVDTSSSAGFNVSGTFTWE